MASGVVRLAPFHYIHVCDNNSGITKVESGPQTFTRQEHETIVFGPAQMVIIPPRHYAVVSNPVARANGLPVHDANGNLKLRHGDEEIRFEQQPFPLFPGEKLVGKVTPLQVVAADAALRLRALRDFVDGKSHRNAGDEWLFYGPATYLPRVEVTVVEVIQALIIKPNQAVKFRARKEFTDRKGVTRKAGELWLIREEGAYLADVDEEYVERVNSITLTEKKALHLRARRTFTDVYGKERRAGEEWLVRLEDAETHIPDVHEELVAEVSLTTLNSRQFCVVLDPVINGKQQFGQRQLRKGPTCFFLMPGERLEQGIQDVHVLAADEALLLTAKESFVDGKVSRKPGDRWMIYGPCDYVPPIQVEVIELRSAIPLDSGEGVYVRDITSGKVTSVIGRSYMLNPNEELWEKDLPAIVEELLSKQAADDKPRDRTRVVAYRAPHNSAVQIYDYKEKKSRVVFGPDLVLLGPDEHFTVLSLSGDKPKRPHVIKALALLLGPDFSTDIVNVETADHARLALKLSYNWHFDVGAKTEEDGVRLFQVPDFVGDACKAIASRVRGAVATSSFDQFHKNSARIIRSSVFGVDDKGKIKNRFFFSANNLVITNIDIQSVQPVDQRTTDALQKSVQLAIEITTKSQEATARHEAERIEQEAKGRLERQKIFDEAKAEKERTLLLQLQANSAFVETTGHAAAEAKAKAEAAQIEGSAAVKQAEFKASATQIMAEVELMQMRESQKLEVEHQRLLNELEVMKAKELALIESQKFEQAVSVIGSDTIEAIAAAGPETQAKLLKGLGLSSFLITDGKSPVNLFNTASGLIGAAPFN